MDGETQRIARLTPLLEVLGRIDALIGPVALRRVAATVAPGRVLAEDVVAQAAVPAVALALRDGFPVAAEALADASSYAPVALLQSERIDAGDALPAGADAVAPLDSVVEQGGRFVAVAPIAPGDGMLAPGADIASGTVLRRAGEVVRASDAAAFAAAGIGEVAVRQPRICVAPARAEHDALIAAAAELIAAAVAAVGGAPRGAAFDVASALADAEADAIIILGGTGRGRNDASVRALAAAGRVEVHGVALMPGETAAFGMVGPRPVLLVPGRLDAVLAVWLTLGRHLLARLTGRMDPEPAATGVLARKHASPLGLTEVVPVRAKGAEIEPIASGYWPLQAIAQANGWILVPSDSEGYPVGAQLVVRPWP